MIEASFGQRTVKAAEDAKEVGGANNPSLSSGEKLAAEGAQRSRIPMSSPKAKLSTPTIEGFHLHWLNDYAGRIQQAIQGGYEFVRPEETLVNNFALASDATDSGSSDMGTRVSAVVGRNDDGSPLRAYLMKVRNEWYTEDQSVVQSRVDALDSAMQQGKQAVDGDTSNRYVSKSSRKSTYSKTG